MCNTDFAASNEGKANVMRFPHLKFKSEDFSDGFFAVLSEDSINS